MAEGSAEIADLLHNVREALRDAVYNRGAALVDRICLSGSLGRGTRAFDWEPCSLVLFLNIDLEFGIYEVPEALKSLATALQTGLEHGGWSSQMNIADNECRGGLWAILRCWRHFTAADAASATAPGAHRSETAREVTDDGAITLQLFLAENMSSSVAANRQAEKQGDAALRDAAGEVVGQVSGNLELSSVDGVKAREQQCRLLSLAERRQKRQACHGDTGKSSAWAAKLSCGTAEAQRLFWSRQPQAALRTARATHGVWQRIVAADQQDEGVESAGQQGDTAGVAMRASSDSDSGGLGRVAADRSPALLGDPFLHLLDVLALHSTAEVGAEARQEAEEGVVVKHVFGVLSMDGAGHGLRVALEGGIFPNGDDGCAKSSEGLGMEQRTAQDEVGGLVVQDPCFPAHDLYAAVCEALAPGDVSSGCRILRRLALKAVEIIS